MNFGKNCVKIRFQKFLVSFTVRDALRHWVHQVWRFRVGWPAQLHPDPSTDLLACRIPVPLYAITGTRWLHFEMAFRLRHLPAWATVVVLGTGIGRAQRHSERWGWDCDWVTASAYCVLLSGRARREAGQFEVYFHKIIYSGGR